MRKARESIDGVACFGPVADVELFDEVAVSSSECVQEDRLGAAAYIQFLWDSSGSVSKRVTDPCWASKRNSILP
jgi:hypothetical protein